MAEFFVDFLELQPFGMGAGAAVCCRDPVSPAEETVSADPASLPGVRTGYGGGAGPAAEPSFRVAALHLGCADRHRRGIYLPLVGGDLLGVSFWDYTGVFGNLRGRVCLPFSLACGDCCCSRLSIW